MEIWDVIDAEGNIIGQCERGAVLPKGSYHGIADIWVMNPAGKLLVTRRDPAKSYGLFWENTAGSLLRGESFKTGTVRELEEETGIKITEAQLLFLERRRERSSIWESYFAVVGVSEDSVRMQPGETVDYRWVTRRELEDMIHRGELASPVVYRFQRVKKKLYQLMDEALS